MPRAMRMAIAFMLATAVVQANQCSGGGECPGDEEPRNVVSLLQTESSLLQKERKTTVPPAKLPRKLHVAVKTHGDFPERLSWERHNPGWSTDFLTDERIEGLFERRFPTKRLEQIAKLGVERSDIGRLLALEAEGGVYVDNDVECLVPIDKWTERFNHTLDDIDVILGVELPRSAGGNPFQITNWAMAAKPGNSLVKHVLEKIVEEAPGIPDDKSTIVHRTGPVAVTSAVLQALEGYGVAIPPASVFNGGEGHLFSLPEKDGHNIQLLILPYRAFGASKTHGDDVVKLPFKQRLVKHGFRGSWKSW